MPLILMTEPALEPITLAEAKAHLRVDVSDDDALITALITAARQYGESETNRSFVTQTWKLILDSFPGPSLAGVPDGVGYSLPGHAVILENPPIQSITSIKYLDMAGVQQTMPPADYVMSKSEPGRVTPVFGKVWPIALPQIGAIEVTYVAGYGDAAANVPRGIRNWLLMRIGSLYEFREEVAIMGRQRIEPLPFVDGLLDSYRVYLY